jgi:hypothetical protein
VHKGIGNSLLATARSTALDRFLHVLASAESASSASKHRDFELITVAKLTPRLCQAGAEILTEGIETLRPVHTDHHHLAMALSFDESHILFPFLV